MSASTYVRYRYRLYTTPGQVQALARAFGCARVVYNDTLAERERARASGEKVTDTEVRPGPRVPDRHRRFHLARMRLGDPARFARLMDDAGDAREHDPDALLIAGRLDAAADRYSERVAAQPTDVSAFAGLALARRHAPTPGARIYSEYPEALHALVGHIRRETGRTPDIDLLHLAP